MRDEAFPPQRGVFRSKRKPPTRRARFESRGGAHRARPTERVSAFFGGSRRGVRPAMRPSRFSERLSGVAFRRRGGRAAVRMRPARGTKTNVRTASPCRPTLLGAAAPPGWGCHAARPAERRFGASGRYGLACCRLSPVMSRMCWRRGGLLAVPVPRRGTHCAPRGDEAHASDEHAGTPAAGDRGALSRRLGRFHLRRHPAALVEKAARPSGCRHRPATGRSRLLHPPITARAPAARTILAMDARTMCRLAFVAAVDLLAPGARVRGCR
jgi:hypothetical protein